VCDACGASASPVVGSGRSIDAQRFGWEESDALRKGRPPLQQREPTRGKGLMALLLTR
jgi:hypothetical protein